jgi:hypothetical protein
MRAALFVWILVPLTAEPGAARACGVSGPDGVSGCSLSEHEEETRKRFRAGASGIYTSTALNFSDGIRADETRVAVLASFAYDPTRRVTLTAGLGAGLGGSLEMPAGRYVFAPGPAALTGVSWRVIDGKPFLSLSADLMFLAATTELSGSSGGATGYVALDLRVGAAFGTTLFDVLTPYALVRAFGGPVFWHYQGAAVTGTDVSHYQVGAGIALAIARRVDVFVEGVPLGERAVAGGAAVAF